MSTSADGAPHVKPLSGKHWTKVARLDFISTAVRQDGFVNVDDLAEALGVSRMTVHRDLDELQGIGTLRKIRGGASAQRSTGYESDLPYRKKSATEEKQRIAAVAAQLANNGDVAIVDDSTTGLEMIPHLAQLSPITVITNFMPAMEELRAHQAVNLIALGGQFDQKYSAFLGLICEKNLSELYADVLFASTSSMHNNILYHQDQRVVSVRRAMLKAARQRVLLIDHTKVGQGALYRLGDITEFTHVVLDDQVSNEVVKSIQEAGVEVLIA